MKYCTRINNDRCAKKFAISCLKEKLAGEDDYL